MDIYIKHGEDFVKVEIETFDKEFVKNKLVNISVSYNEDGKAFTAEDLESISRTLGEFFKGYGSDIFVTTGCDVNMFVYDKLTTDTILSARGK